MADDVVGLGKAIEAATKELGELVKPLVRPGVEIVGEMMTDELRYLQLRRRSTLVRKAMKVLADRNIVIVQGAVRSDDPGRAAVSLLRKCSSGLLITPR
jgi:hypothetical protein